MLRSVHLFNRSDLFAPVVDNLTFNLYIPKNLDLVTDAYSRGIKSIIELLDAQNQSLVASQTAAMPSMIS